MGKTFSFTQDEREELQEILKPLEGDIPEKISSFLNDLEKAVGEYLIIRKGPGRKQQQKIFGKKIGVIEKALYALAEIRYEWHVEPNTRYYLQEACENLDDFWGALKESLAGLKGKTPAPFTLLITKAAQEFYVYFGTIPKDSKSDIFSKLIEKISSLVKDPGDYRKAIRTAISYLRKSSNLFD